MLPSLLILIPSEENKSMWRNVDPEAMRMVATMLSEAECAVVVAGMTGEVATPRTAVAVATALVEEEGT